MSVSSHPLSDASSMIPSKSPDQLGGSSRCRQRCNFLERPTQPPRREEHPGPSRIVTGAVWLLGLVPALSSCGTVAVNDPEFMSIEKFEQGAETIRYEHAAETVWIHVKETLVHLSSRQPDFSDETMRAFATVEDGSIQIGIVPIGNESCRMAVRAREFGLSSEELARRVLNRITEEIER